MHSAALEVTGQVHSAPSMAAGSPGTGRKTPTAKTERDEATGKFMGSWWVLVYVYMHP